MKPIIFREEVFHQLGLDINDRLQEDERRLEQLREEIREIARRIIESAPKDMVHGDVIQAGTGSSVTVRRRFLTVDVQPDPALVGMILSSTEAEGNGVSEVLQRVTLGVHDLERAEGEVFDQGASVDVVTTVMVGYRDSDIGWDRATVVEQVSPAHPVFYPLGEDGLLNTGRILCSPRLEPGNVDISSEEMTLAAERVYRDPSAAYEGMLSTLNQMQAALEYLPQS